MEVRAAQDKWLLDRDTLDARLASALEGLNILDVMLNTNTMLKGQIYLVWLNWPLKMYGRQLADVLFGLRQIKKKR